jgi:hypothetical protein
VAASERLSVELQRHLAVILNIITDASTIMVVNAIRIIVIDAIMILVVGAMRMLLVDAIVINHIIYHNRHRAQRRPDQRSQLSSPH